MTFRREHDAELMIQGRPQFYCGALPTSIGLNWAFLEHAHFSKGEGYFPSTVHWLASGLAAGHLRASGKGADPDSVVSVWESARLEVVELESAIDRAVAAVLPEPRSEAEVHSERFGSFLGRLARLWVGAPPTPFALGRYGAENRNRLFEQLLSRTSVYTNLVHNLEIGLVRLPPMGPG